MTRMWARTIIIVYAFGLLCFFLAAFSQIWIFTGGANYETVVEEDFADGGATIDELGDSVVRLDTGELRIACLDPRLSSSHEKQARISMLFAGITSGGTHAVYATKWQQSVLATSVELFATHRHLPRTHNVRALPLQANLGCLPLGVLS